MLEQFVVVLHQPRDLVNIGGVVRAMKNMGLRYLRLVAPPCFDVTDILRIAHRSDDILTTMQILPDLDAALADVIYVVGTTEHHYANLPTRSDIRQCISELFQRATTGRVALLFGSEQNGLEHRHLDRCQTIINLPVNRDYPSLNLAQAALLLMYELRMALSEEPSALPQRTPVDEFPASAADLATFFTAVEQALAAVEFFKSNTTSHIMRVVRRLVYRAEPNRREIALITAMAREIVKFLQRRIESSRSEQHNPSFAHDCNRCADE